jgi:hypothetical protein
MPRLSRRWNLIIVDDDVGGPYPPPPRDPLIATLQSGGIDLVVGDEAPTDEVGATVIALFGDIRAWKGRPGYSQTAKDAVRRALDAAGSRERLIIQFSHPRLAPGLQTDAPILCAWGGEGVMQKAAGRVLLREIAAGGAERKAQLPQSRVEESL